MTEPEEKRRRLPSRAFLRLWFAQGVEELGSNVSTLALTALAVLAFHAGPLPIGILYTVRFTVMPIAGLSAGPLVDRFPPGRLMRVTFLIRAFALGSFPLAALFHVISTGQIHGITGESVSCSAWGCAVSLQMLWVYSVVAIEAACNGIFTVAWETVLPRMVERTELEAANAKLATTAAFGTLAGPGAGGLAAQLFGPATTLLGNVGAFIVASGVLGRVDRHKDLSAAAEDEGNADPPADEAAVEERATQRDAWRLLRVNRILRRTILTRMISNLGAGVTEANLLIFLFGSGLTVGAIGLAFAVAEVGSFVGAFVTGRVSKFVTVGARLVILPILMGAAELLVPFSTTTQPDTCAAGVARGHAAGSINFPGAEGEPMVATDPLDQAHVVAVYQQDRWNDGGANAINTLFSYDGGRTFALASGRPAFSVCAGAQPGSPGYFDRASDPWVSFGPDGTVYQSAIAFDMGGPALGGASTVMVSASRDGGVHWKTPTSLITDPSPLVLNDKAAVTADPLRPGTAYTAWDRIQYQNAASFRDDPNSMSGPTMFSVTHDGGATWSYGRPIYDPGPRSQTFDDQIIVVPAGPDRGSLVDGFLLIKCGPHVSSSFGSDPAAECKYFPATSLSRDGGATWSPPRIIASMGFAEVHLRVDGQDRVVRTGDIFPQFSADPATGKLYAVWQDTSLSPSHVVKVVFTSSADGVSWSPPVAIGREPADVPAFIPQIRVAGDGGIAISRFDLRDATVTHPGTTGYYEEQCQPKVANCEVASSWGETPITSAGPFDVTSADDANGYFLGDYMGLSATTNGWINIYVVAGLAGTNHPTDVMANTVTEGGSASTATTLAAVAGTPALQPATPFSTVTIWMVILGLFIAALVNTVFDITNMTIRGSVTPDRLLGPVMALSFALMMGCVAVGTIIGGVVGSNISPGTGIVIGSVIVCLAGAMGIGRRLGTVESYNNPVLERFSFALQGHSIDRGRLMPPPRVRGSGHYGTLACTFTGCERPNLTRCAYIDRQGRQCDTLWCGLHGVAFAGSMVCRRHHAIISSLCPEPTWTAADNLPPLDNYAASLALHLGTELEKRLLRRVASEFPGKDVSIAPGKLIQEGGPLTPRVWTFRLWVIPTGGPGLTATLAVAEENDKFVTLLINGVDVARGTAPWITRRAQGGLMDASAERLEREQFYEALMAPVIHLLSRTLK